MNRSLVYAGDHQTEEDFSHCKQWIRIHSKSFYLSSLLLPKGVRRESWALYAFCRRADDAADGKEEPGAERKRRIESLERRLLQVYDPKKPELADPIDRAFCRVVERAAIPKEVPQSLLAGMNMDLRGSTYETWEDLLRYCFHVASTVGLMMTAVMGHQAQADRHAEVLLRAADLGVAMQLTNIARDVGEDARMGRVYLPTALLKKHGSSSKEVLDLGEKRQPPSEGLKGAIAELLLQADKHYQAADQGIVFLPISCQLAIRSARLIYAAIGQRVEQNGYDSLRTRAAVSLFGKLRLCFSAWQMTKPMLLPAQTKGPADETLRGFLSEVGLAQPLRSHCAVTAQ